MHKTRFTTRDISSCCTWKKTLDTVGKASCFYYNIFSQQHLIPRSVMIFIKQVTIFDVVTAVTQRTFSFPFPE